MENEEKVMSVEQTEDLQPVGDQAAEVVPVTAVTSEEGLGGEGRTDGVTEEGRKERAEGPSVVETASPSDAVKDRDSPTVHHALVGYLLMCSNV